MHLTSRVCLFIVCTVLVAGCLENAPADASSNVTFEPPGGADLPSPVTVLDDIEIPQPPESNQTTELISPEAEPQEPGTPALTMNLGVLIPRTGALASFGPHMEKAARLAVADINAADKGIVINASYDDDQSTDVVAIKATFNRLVAKGITGLVGPCCSAVTGSILDLAIQSQVVVASPSATSPDLTARQNVGYFWRVSPTELGQGRVLAGLVMESNVQTVSIIAVDNPYGNGLAGVFENEFSNLSGVVRSSLRYAEGSRDFSTIVDAVCRGSDGPPAGIVLVAYSDDAARIIRRLHTEECLRKVTLFASEAAFRPDTWLAEQSGKDSMGRWLVEGMRGTAPQPTGARFVEKYRAAYDAEPGEYGAEYYDAVVQLALASLKAGSVNASEYKWDLLNIVNAPGTKCTDFEACAKLVRWGTPIDYVGMAHDLEFSAKNEPKSGAYAYWVVTPEGAMTITKENVVAA